MEKIEFAAFNMQMLRVLWPILAIALSLIALRIIERREKKKNRKK